MVGGYNKNKFLISFIFVGILVLMGVLFLRVNKQLADTKLALDATQRSLNDKTTSMALEIKELKEQLGKNVTETDELYYFPCYGPDHDAMEIEVNFYVGIPNQALLRTKLETLADRLSRFRFDYHPIELVDIEDHLGKEVAVINLKEKPSFYKGDNYGRSWARNYFQGSTGASMTWATLERTLLQRKYKGRWIDGLKVLYEGEVLSEEKFEHLGGIPDVIWR